MTGACSRSIWATIGSPDHVVVTPAFAYALLVVSVADKDARQRKANIKAACRIALRIARTGRGCHASLTFLEGVTQRELGRAATIVPKGTAPVCVTEHECPEISPWTTPIVVRSGAVLGEVRLAASPAREFTAADFEALAIVARAAARILAWASDPNGRY